MRFIPNKGDLIWLDFTPQSGHEQKGKRPALVISNNFFNNKTGLAIVCPITSTKRDFPLHVEINSCRGISGFIMIEQVKSIDFTARNVEFIEQAPPPLVNEVLSRLFACMY